MRETKEIVEAIVNGTALKKKVREEEKNLANTNDKSFLIFLKDNSIRAEKFHLWLGLIYQK